MYKIVNFDEYFENTTYENYFKRHREIIRKNKDYILALISDIIIQQNFTNKPIYLNLSTIREKYLKSNKIVHKYVKQYIIEYRDCIQEFEYDYKGKRKFKKMLEYTTLIINQNLCIKKDFELYRNTNNYVPNNYHYEKIIDKSDIIDEIKIRLNQDKKTQLFDVNQELYNIEKESFEKIANKDECDLLPIFCSTVANNGRNYNNIAQMRKEDRARILLNDGTKPVELDVKSCLPWILTQKFIKKIENKTPFIEKFIFWVENPINNNDIKQDIYTFLLDIVKKNYSNKKHFDRSKIKTDVLMYFSQKTPLKYIPLWLDKESFELFEKMKSEQGHLLAKIYQKIESEIFIKRFKNLGYKFIFPIHDCYLCHKDDVVKLKSMIESIFMEEFETKPTLEISYGKKLAG